MKQDMECRPKPIVPIAAEKDRASAVFCPSMPERHLTFLDLSVWFYGHIL
jgi:hypothetical protein